MIVGLDGLSVPRTCDLSFIRDDTGLAWSSRRTARDALLTVQDDLAGRRCYGTHVCTPPSFRHWIQLAGFRPNFDFRGITWGHPTEELTINLPSGAQIEAKDLPSLADIKRDEAAGVFLLRWASKVHEAAAYLTAFQRSGS
ncbi:hypothetical protein KRR38_31430 [Novosphingobium sp. G106]|uniref:hypothetical protein n=1 Tax=Novosphingobium sp. G106 TaxID=2849500 RepID=UPI001C2D3A8B|nr:hypothetical protein [Novosphingobium sp. G106]MBV1692061.1 hypothetical protein [Novosphingobium sp. G106]